MNKRIIIGILVLLVSVGAIFGVLEYVSYKQVSIVFKQPDVSIDIYSENQKKVSSASEDTTTKLKTGSYYYIPTTERYSSEKVNFEVSSDEIVEINPSYSKSFLSTLLTQERDAIQSVIIAAYPLITSDYIIADENLAGQGEWYSAKLIQRVSGGNEPDVYRVVLTKNAATWAVVVSPRLIVSVPNFSTVPNYIIRQVNEPLSNEAYVLLYPE